MLTRFALGLSVVFLDLVLSFVSWAYHPSNVAVPETAMPGTTILFELATFPTLSILPAAIANEFSWTVLICNSLLWGAMAMWLYASCRRAINRRSQLG
jgi:hypothetical protein